jgi:hypothetical protein
MYGILKEDIYETTCSVILNREAWCSKTYADSLFKVVLKKGTKLYEKNSFWSTKSGNEKINQFKPLKDFLEEKPYHPIFSNLDVRNIKPQKRFAKK